MSTQEMIVAPKMHDVSPEYAEILMLGNVLQKSGYFKDVRDAAQAVTKILFGRELGFSPIVSISGIHVIEGKPALSSNLMATLIKRSGKYDYRVKVWTNAECVLTFREKVIGKWEDVGESSFTMDDAKTAGLLGKGVWAKYPKPMLFSRALSQGLRTYCPDVSASPIYVPEEMGAEVNEDGDVLELPKSARNVERTTEETPVEKPRAAAANATPPTPVTSVPQTDADGQKLPPVPPPLPPVSYVECITVGQAKNFAITFKNALRKELQKDADGLKHDWLKQQGIVDVLGAGSALAIRADSFYECRDEAEKFARSL